MKTLMIQVFQKLSLLGLFVSCQIAMAAHEDIELGKIQRGNASHVVLARHFDFGQGNQGTWLIEKAPDGAFLFRGINLSHDGKCDSNSADYWKNELKKKDIKLTLMNPGTDFCGTLMPSSIPGLIPKHTRSTVEDCAVFYKQDNDSTVGLNKSHKYYDPSQKKCLPCSDGSLMSSMCAGVKLGSKKACPKPADAETLIKGSNTVKAVFFKIDNVDKGPYISEISDNKIKIPTLIKYQDFIKDYDPTCFKNLDSNLFAGCSGKEIYYPALPTAQGENFTLTYQNKLYSVPKNLDHTDCPSYVYSTESSGGQGPSSTAVTCEGVTWKDGELLGIFQGTQVYTYVHENRIYIKREDSMNKAFDNIDILFHLSNNRFPVNEKRNQVANCVNPQDPSTSGMGYLGGANSEGVLCNGKRIADNTLLGIYTGGDNVKTNVYAMVVDGKLFPNFHREGETRGSGINWGLLMSITKGDGQSKFALTENEILGCFGRELPKKATPVN